MHLSHRLAKCCNHIACHFLLDWCQQYRIPHLHQDQMFAATRVPRTYAHVSNALTKAQYDSPLPRYLLAICTSHHNTINNRGFPCLRMCILWSNRVHLRAPIVVSTRSCLHAFHSTLNLQSLHTAIFPHMLRTWMNVLNVMTHYLGYLDIGTSSDQKLFINIGPSSPNSPCIRVKLA